MTVKFSSTTWEPICGVLLALTMAFPEGDTFVILPSFCKRVSPLENHVRSRSCAFKRFWTLLAVKVLHACLRRKVIK